MKQILKIKHKFPSLNDYIDTARGNKYASNQDKRELTELVAYECMVQHIKPVKSARISFIWCEKNRNREDKIT